MQSLFMWILTALLMINLGSCDKEKKGTPKKTAEAIVNISPAQSAYQINAPDQVWSLTSKLKEISGLAFDATNKELIAINDEMGVSYRLDINNGAVNSTHDFAGKGDYEGIEVVDNLVYAVESNGTLHQVLKDGKSNPIPTSLKGNNDIEGLGYDPTTSMLLLACKGKPSIKADQGLKKTKVVYGFDVANQQFKEEPIIIIADSTLLQFCDTQLSSSLLDEAKKKDYKKRIKSFAPSAIAYNQNDNSYYMLSSVGKTMVVLDRMTNIKSLDFLDKDLHRQPEGIVFDNENNLYISNEGKYGVAKIFKYNH